MAAQGAGRHAGSRATDKAGMKMYISGPLLFALEAGERRGFMYRAYAR
jgi:hypothetical protein